MKHIFDVYPRFEINLVTGKGTFVFDENGQKYLDLYGGHGVISIGHSHPVFVENLKKQLDKISFYSNSILMPKQEELAAEILEQCNYKNYELFFCNCGAEANENALKLASFHTKKKKVIAFKNSFHGRTAATLNVTDNPNLSAPINIKNFDVEFLELNNKEQIVQALKKSDVSAVILEGIQGVGGLDTPTPEFLKFLRKITEEKNVLLILDEIQSGFGRTGKFFAHQYGEIQADLVTMAKGMGNGFPVAGVLISPKIKAKKGMLGTTFGGNYLACEASLSVLKVLKEENILNHVLEIEKYFLEELKSLEKIKKIKGKGLMLGIEFDAPISDLRKELLQKYHIFTGASANPNLLRILPPLNIQKQDLALFVKALKTILS
ncbi:aspartate aminotransferase family protein [Aureivirga sp. CE67]|uniref:aspartate aminotransferase family protein n=1 Tax=Aureivirga sp. CE67 TaxID=1788983 RepID=UPI0018C92B52|nr:aminotransferase class III-fold pyridoxal phosphate-dependent enzyme [Aureivirga sp. CE67]